MFSRVYLLDSGETVGIYSDVEHEVLKTILKPWPILNPGDGARGRHTKHVAWRACQNRELGSGVRTIQEA